MDEKTIEILDLIIEDAEKAKAHSLSGNKEELKRYIDSMLWLISEIQVKAKL